MISSTPYLFVYSSLRRGFQSPAYEYITQYFTYVSEGKIKGILSDLGDHPVGTPTDDDRYIVGEIYKLNGDHGSYVFGQLDDYEGLHPEDGQAAYFRRDIATVYPTVGDPVQAWTYWYTGDVSGKPVVDSGDVFEYIRSRYGG